MTCSFVWVELFDCFEGGLLVIIINVLIGFSSLELEERRPRNRHARILYQSDSALDARG